MDEKTTQSGRVKVALPIRIRGMSTQNKFFDEETETVLVSPHQVVTRLRNLVDLETEVHVMSLKTKVGGTYRAIWLNGRGTDGSYLVGLELVEPEGDLWELEFPPGPTGGETLTAPQAWLECQRCRQKAEMPIPEVEDEFLCEGFVIARACERCRATTPWRFSSAGEETEPAVEGEAATSPPSGPAAAHPPKPREEQRTKGRAPIKMQIKVIRHKYGTILEDICETENVSRHGAYFLSSQNYEPGEVIQVIIPYKEGDLVIPVPARVVRQDQPSGSFYHAVAIQLQGERK